MYALSSDLNQHFSREDMQILNGLVNIFSYQRCMNQNFTEITHPN